MCLFCIRGLLQVKLLYSVVNLSCVFHKHGCMATCQTPDNYMNLVKRGSVTRHSVPYPAPYPVPYPQRGYGTAMACHHLLTWHSTLCYTLWMCLFHIRDMLQIVSFICVHLLFMLSKEFINISCYTLSTPSIFAN